MNMLVAIGSPTRAAASSVAGTGGVHLPGPAADLHVRGDRAVLLREARHVEHRHALALEMRRHAENLPDRDHAGAADARDEHPIGRLERGRRWLGERRDAGYSSCLGPPTEPRAFCASLLAKPGIALHAREV